MLFSGVYILWEDPLILSCQGSAELSVAFQIRRPAHILYSPTWLWTLRSLPRLFFKWLQARRSGKVLHFMDNARQSNGMLRQLNFPGDLISINAYIDEHLFRITNDRQKKYDAVYAAGMVPYKRLYLAAKIPSLFVQTYGDCRTADGAYDLARYEPAVRHAEYNRCWVDGEDIVTVYNQASVGLALSKCEGAMLASVEYMLCGLPQVSTPCRGGREMFFDDRFVKIVEPTAEAVAAGVAEMKSRKIDPYMIREETLKKLQSHRLSLCDYIIRIIQMSGKSVPGRNKLYDRLFENKYGIHRWFVHFRNLKDYGLA